MSHTVVKSFLWIAAAALWIVVGLHEVCSRATFLDDAFIYLSICRNIVDTGSAQFFPIANSPALLASSPLRLAALAPSFLVADTIHGAERGIATAGTSFYASALVTTIAALPFIKVSHSYSAIAVCVAALMAMTTSSMLQMEGCLVYWLAFLLVREHMSARSLRRTAILLSLLCLARLEFGLAATVSSAIVNRKELAQFVRATLCIFAFAALIWIVAAVILGVWPIPTTYLSKVLTGESRLFGPRFLNAAHESLASYFVLLPGKSGGRLTLLLVLAATIGAMSKVRGGRFSAVTLSIVLLMMSGAPGNYIWYYENIIIFVVASMLACAGGVASSLGQRRAAKPICALLAFYVASMAITRIGHNDQLAWRIRGSGSYGARLVAVARQHVGHGRFRFSDPRAERERSGFLIAWEIGILTYFAGADCWLLDRGGLAQPGQLAEATDFSFLRAVYPKDALRSGQSELDQVRRAYGSAPVFEVEFMPASRGGLDQPSGARVIGVTIRETGQ